MKVKDKFSATKEKKYNKKIKKVEKNYKKNKETRPQITLNFQEKLELAKEDKMLKKVEEYVNRNREKTSQEIMERKRKRPANNYKEGDLDVLISRVSIESKPQEKSKEISKLILYIIYAVIIIAVLAFIIKFFFIGNIIPQIG